MEKEITISHTCTGCIFADKGKHSTRNMCAYYRKEIPELWESHKKPDYCKIEKVVVTEKEDI